jgi:hypothetical protein
MIAGNGLIVRLFGLGMVGGLLIVWCSLGGCCSVERNAEKPAPAFSPAAAVTEPEAGASTGVRTAEFSTINLESKPLEAIPPGTVIGKTAPSGWSNFIMIAVPTLTKEDIRDAPKVATKFAQMFKFTLLAKSEKSKEGYRLKTVARGFAMTVKNQELIVDSRKTFGADLGMFGARILAENEKHIDADVRTVARTETMFMFDAKAVMRQGTEHVPMILRHAVVVDPATGKAHTFIWLMSKDGEKYTIAEKELQYIPEGTREARFLSVKRDKFVLGLPTPEAFALIRTPQGKALKWTAELEKLANPKEPTKDEVVRLEKVLLTTGQTLVPK